MSTKTTRFLVISALIAICVSSIPAQRQQLLRQVAASPVSAGAAGGYSYGNGPILPAPQQAQHLSRPFQLMPAQVLPTQPSAGLVINGVLDSSVTSNPNSAAISSAITAAIARYQARFNDPVTVKILFRFATTTEDNTTPFPAGGLGRSFWTFYFFSWAGYTGLLAADSKTANDATAVASLPGAPLSGNNVFVGAPNARALGQAAFPGVCANGTLNFGDPSCNYDGIISLNANVGVIWAFSRPVAANAYDMQRVLQHEMDEVLGSGSGLDFADPLVNYRPMDMFTYSAAGTRNITTTTSPRYFSINGGTTNLVGFNQVHTGDTGDYFSGTCPKGSTPYVQDAFSCQGDTADFSGTTPEGIMLDIIGYDLTNPTAAGVEVSGRVSTPDGRGIRGARVSLTGSGGRSLTAVTNALGFYSFTSVTSGESYVLDAAVRGRTFVPRVITVSDQLANVDMVALA